MQTKEIKKWLIDADLDMKSIAMAAGVSLDLVSKVIKGERSRGIKAKKVIRVLKKRGCPAEFLKPVEKEEGNGSGK